NYTITQPKTQFFNRYRKILDDRYDFSGGYKFSYNAVSSIALSGSTKTTINSANNNNDILTQISGGKIISRLNNLNEAGYNIEFLFTWQRSADGQHDASVIGLQGHIYARTSAALPPQDYDTYLLITKKYYDSNDALLHTTTSEVPVYKFVSYTEQDCDIKMSTETYIIKELAPEQGRLFNITIEKSETYDYAIAEIEIHRKQVLVNFVDNVNLYDTSQLFPATTNIIGFNNDISVKAQINYIELSIVSTQVSEALTEPKQTLLDFVEKALFDYNFNRRNKLTLGEDTRVLLDVFANESEWSGYNFRELLVRAFKYVGAIPYLTIDRVITAIKPKVFDTTLVIDDLEDDDENINDEDYFDTIVSNAKNLVSDTDFATETVFIGGGTDEFSQITDTNAAFTFNNAIYYISKAVLYAPNVSFTIPLAGGGTSAVNSNMDQANYWDITERVLDNNLYKALPNVNFSSISGRTSSELGQGNTISFTSGSRKIDNVINRAPDVPSYNPISQNQQLSEYAIIELLICLAYEYLMGQYAYDKTDFTSYSYNGQLDDIIQMELTLTFVPYHKEITTKFISNKTDRIGLHYQKKVNISDRTIDYKENQLVLTNEMNRKGNIQKFVPVKYKSLEEVIPVGSIINDGKYVVTSKRLVLHNEMVECEYTLDSEMLNQNTDIGLSVEYEAYNVPYEYVLREMFIDNHLVFSKSITDMFSSDESGCNISLLEDIFIKDTANDKTLDKEIYARFAISYESETAKYIFMSLKRLTSRFSMILNGNLVDNYSAGNQRYSVDVEGEYLWYSQPYRYTDYRGRFAAIYSMLIGYTPNAKYHISNYYDLNLFPYTDGYSFGRWLYLNNNFHVMKKDSREAISLNY
ncbi:MAG: hypothetical protein RBR39_13080, partial [Proteiniphilum sp.]|nr:hypothetical protein [Proteiniphilum sp.]